MSSSSSSTLGVEVHTRCPSCQLRTGNEAIIQSHQNLTKVDWKSLFWRGLSKCWDIQMVWSEFGINSMEAGFNLPCINGSGWWWWWCNVWVIFSWHTLGSLEQFENHIYIVAYLTMSICLWPQWTHIPKVTSSRIMHQVAKLRSSQTDLWNMKICSLFFNGLPIRSQSIGCGGSREHTCIADKSTATA